MLKDSLIYHPNRFIYCRPFLKGIIKKYRYSESDEEITDDYNSRIEFYESFPTSKSSEELDELISCEDSLYFYYLEYLNKGQNIFHFPNELLSLFKNTDVDDVYLKYINFPYIHFYLHFGLQKELLLFEDNYYVDGAYIRYDPEEQPYLTVFLTTFRPNIEYNSSFNIIEQPDQFYRFDLLVDEHSTVGLAIEQQFKSYKEAGLEKVIENKFIPGFEVFKRSLRLIINSLFYLSSEHKEIVSRYPPYVPETLLNKLDKATSENVERRNKSKLENQGYTRINFCGDSIKNYYESIPTGKELSAHWRRGHWRNQVFGEKFKQNKLIWIKPTLVRKDKGDSAHGHIYDI